MALRKLEMEMALSTSKTLAFNIASKNIIVPTIPRAELNKFNIFKSFPYTNDDETIKQPILAYVFGNTGLIVTVNDDVYAVGEVNGTKQPSQELVKVRELCGFKIKDFAAGRNDSCYALTDDGEVYSWGDSNEWGQLGQGNTEMSKTPKKVEGSLTGKCVIQVAASKSHVLVITKNGEVHSWGNNSYGQLGLEDRNEVVNEPTLIPQQAFENAKATGVAACEFGSVVMIEDGGIFQLALAKEKSDLLWAGWKKYTTPTTFKKVTGGDDVVWGLSAKGKLYLFYNHTSDSDEVDLWGEDILDIASDPKFGMTVLQSNDGISVCGIYGGKYSSVQMHHYSSMHDAFATLCSITYKTIKPSKYADIECHQNGINQSVLELWQQRGDSNPAVQADVVFSVDGQHLPGHKTILMMRSDYFAKMFNGDWKESLEECIPIGGGWSYETFQAYMFYIYSNNVLFSSQDYLKTVALMKLADANGEIKLHRTCETNLMRNITNENVFFLLKNALSANAKDLEEETLSYLLTKKKEIPLSNDGKLEEVLDAESMRKLVYALCNC